MSTRVRLASVGLGNWSDVLARAVSRGSVAEIVNCWSRSPESRARFQAEHNIVRAASSFDDLLSDPEVEGVLVTTPNDSHRSVIVEALAAGKSVYTDKPIAHTLGDAVVIKRAVERSEGVFAVGHSARRLSGHRVMKEWIEAGVLGGISMVEAHFTTRRGFALTPDAWRYFEASSPGGALIQLGVHHTDTLQHLLGPVRTVSAHARRLFIDAEVPDTVMVLMEFDSGVVGTLATGWAAPALYQMRLFGTEANLFFDLDLGYWNQSDVVDSKSRLEIQSRGNAVRSEVGLEPTDMFREQVEEFALTIRGGEKPEVTLGDSLRALAVVLAAVESSERGGSPVVPADLIARAESSTSP